MAIKATCGNCRSSFNAKDTLAGRRVKCPKCGEKMVVPEKMESRKKRVDPTAGSFDVMDELLKEANIKTVAVGPVCDNCAAELKPGAVMCIECGFNTQTQEVTRGVKSDADDYDDPNDEHSAAQKMLRQAEKDIAETPVNADDQDFGDGADSLVIAGVAGLILLAMIGIGLIIIFLMDNLSDVVHSSFISMVAAIIMAVACIAWITIVAFLSNQTQGIICLATAGAYCIVFGFMQGKQLLLPTIILIFSVLIAIASGLYFSNLDALT